MRWDLIDRFIVLKKGSLSRAEKIFHGTEDFFAEHFPHHPTVPEPLFLEMIAQTGGVLLGLSHDFKKEVILVKIEGAEFGTSLGPPCALTIEAVLEEEREDGGWVRGRVTCGTKEVARARVLLALLDRLEDQRRSIVFNDQFLKHYRIYEVASQEQT